MNIQCENCSTRYTIADDVVAGGVYQVRCKRCESIFTISGMDESHAPGAQPARLRGQRNENSLLFSVNDLTSPTTGPAPPGAASEGSGLLDIRRLSGAYADEPGNHAQPRPDEDWAPITPVGQVLPHLVQPRASTSSPNRLLWVLTSIAGVVAVAAVALGFVLIKDQGEPGTRPAALPATELTAPARPGPAMAALEPRPEQPAGEPAQPAREPADEPAAKPAHKPEDSEPADSEPAETRPAREVARNESREREPRRERTRTEPRPPQPEKSDKPEPARRLDEVGCLLAPEPPAYCDKYLKASRPDTRRADEPRENRPVRPSRGDIQRGMSKVSGLVTSCGSNHPGTGQVTLSIKVDGDGEVSSVSVKDSPDPSLGSCVARAARKASFPASQQGITFSYPFMFR